jgi:hypothetical protein
LSLATEPAESVDESSRTTLFLFPLAPSNMANKPTIDRLDPVTLDESLLYENKRVKTSNSNAYQKRQRNVQDDIQDSIPNQIFSSRDKEQMENIWENKFHHNNADTSFIEVNPNRM